VPPFSGPQLAGGSARWVAPQTQGREDSPFSARKRAIQDFERELQASLDGPDNRIGRMRQRSEHPRAELGNLAATAAQCGHTPALVKEINSRQQELEGIARQLLSSEPDSISAEIRRIRHFVTGQFCEIRQLLYTDALKAKLEPGKPVKDIRMNPQVEGEWNLSGGYDGDANLADPRFGLVAGEGFEPSTFGL